MRLLAVKGEIGSHMNNLAISGVRSLDLHTHLRGTFLPEVAQWLSEKNSVTLPEGAVSKDGRYEWRDFSDFLSVYDSIGASVKGPEDLQFITELYLKSCAESNSAYVEFMLSPAHSEENGIGYVDQISAISAGIRSVCKATGIEARIIVTCVRHRGPIEAMQVAELVELHPHEYVVGFGMTGDERSYDPEEFIPAFRKAKDAGLGLTAHAGEWLGAKSVLRTVDALNLDRIGHGIRAAEDRGVIAEIAAREIGFEVCLSSNVKLRAVESFERHPLPAMLEAGCRVSLATDDPAYFDTSPSNEYRIASTVLGVSCADLEKITSNAIDIAFCNTDTKTQLRN